MGRQQKPRTINSASGTSVGITVIRELLHAIIVVFLLGIFGSMIFTITFIARLAAETPRAVLFGLGIGGLILAELIIPLIDAIVPL